MTLIKVRSIHAWLLKLTLNDRFSKSNGHAKWRDRNIPTKTLSMKLDQFSLLSFFENNNKFSG